MRLEEKVNKLENDLLNDIKRINQLEIELKEIKKEVENNKSLIMDNEKTISVFNERNKNLKEDIRDIKKVIEENGRWLKSTLVSLIVGIGFVLLRNILFK